MAKKISQKQIVQSDLWQNTIESTKELISFTEALDFQFKKLAKSSKGIVSSNHKSTVEGLKATAEEVEKLNKAYEAKVKLDKERKKLEADLIKLQKKVEEEQKKLNETLGESAESYQELNKQTKKAEKIAKDLAIQYGKTDSRTIEAVKTFTKLKTELIKVNKVTSENVKENQKKLALQEKLNKLAGEEAKELAVISVQIQEQNKANKELAKEKLRLLDTYDRESKRLIKLRRELKNVVLSEGKSSKATKKLRKEVKALDKQLKEADESAGQFQRNVGNYPDSLRNATDSILGIASALGVMAGATSAVKGGLAATEEGGGAMAELGATIEGVWSVASNATANAALDAIDYVKAVKGAVDSGKGIIESLSDSADGTGRTASLSFEKLQASAELQITLKKALVKKERAYAKTLRETNEEVEVLNGAIEIQQVIAGDSTISFEELNTAVLKSQQLQTERAELNISLAKQELDLSQQKVFISEQLNNDGNASISLYDEETEAINKLQGAQNDFAKETLENEKETRQIRQDRLERDLDILLDGYDNQKTINERIIASDKETIKTRQDLQDETVRLGNKSFEGQVKILGKLTKHQLDYNELLTIDATELNQRIRSLGASEIIEGRILEVLRDRKTGLNDLKESQEDLNDSTFEYLDLQTDISTQYDKLLGKIKDIDDKRLENEKESLKKQIKSLKTDSNEQLRLIKRYNEILLGETEKYEDEESKRLDDIAKRNADRDKNSQDKEKEQDNLHDKYLEHQEEKQRQKEIESREKTLTVLSELNTKYFNDKKSQADQEIEDAKNREQSLTDLANNGNKDAVESLAENQKQQAEANRKKEDLLKKEKQFEMALAMIQAYNTALDSGKSNAGALSEAVTSVAVLSSIAQSLPSFYDGTEDTGTTLNPLDSNGGRLSILHDNERVMDKANNDKLGGVSNNEVADIVQSYNSGLLTDITQFNTPNINIESNQFESNKEILDKFDKLEKSLVSAITNKETYLGSDVDVMKNILSQYYKENGTKTTIKSKVNIW